MTAKPDRMASLDPADDIEQHQRVISEILEGLVQQGAVPVRAFVFPAAFAQQLGEIVDGELGHPGALLPA